MGILSTSKYVYPNYTLQDWENNHSICLDTHWIYCEWNIIQNSINYVNSERPHLNWRVTIIVNVFRNQHYFKTSIQKNTENLFPFPQCSIILVKGQRSLWGKTVERLTVKHWVFNLDPFSGEPGCPFLKMILGLQTGSSYENLFTGLKFPFGKNQYCFS